MKNNYFRLFIEPRIVILRSFTNDVIHMLMCGRTWAEQIKPPRRQCSVKGKIPSYHSYNFFFFVSCRIAELMDLSADDITNNILYDHCHAADLQKLRKSHVDCKPVSCYCVYFIPVRLFETLRLDSFPGF